MSTDQDQGERQEQPADPSLAAEPPEEPSIQLVYEALEGNEGSGDAGSGENQSKTETQQRVLSDEELDNLLIPFNADGEKHQGTVREAQDRLAQGKHLDRLMQQIGRYNNLLERLPEAMARLEQLESGQARDERGRFTKQEPSFDFGEEDEMLTVRSAKTFGQQLVGAIDQTVDARVREVLRQDSDERSQEQHQRHIRDVMVARNLGPEHVPLAQKRIQTGRAKNWEEAADQVAKMEQAAEIDPYDFEHLSPETQKRYLSGVVPVLKKARGQQQQVRRETSPGQSPGRGPEPKLEDIDIMKPSNIEAVMEACEAIEEK